jgi:uncharacterized RDD family membrane protein YckC
MVAGAGNRFLALVVDLGIQILVLIGILLALGLLAFMGKWTLQDLSGRFGGDAAIWVVAGVVLVLFAVQWGYFTFFETVWAGQTPGKRYQRIRVIRETGRPIGFTDAAIRNLFRVVLDGQPYPWHAVGLIVGLLNQRFKRLGDYAAGTVVIVERRRTVPPTGARLRAPIQPPSAEAPLLAGRLSREELVALHAYLRRRDELSAEIRDAMAAKIAVSLLARLAISRPPGMGDDALLEWLDEGIRKSGTLRQPQ